jgi:hypothetical protein
MTRESPIEVLATIIGELRAQLAQVTEERDNHARWHAETRQIQAARDSLHEQEAERRIACFANAVLPILTVVDAMPIEEATRIICRVQENIANHPDAAVRKLVADTLGDRPRSKSGGS